MTKQYRYGQKSNRRRIQVDLPPELTGKPAIIKAGAKSHYGKEFLEDTPCVFHREHSKYAYEYALRLPDGKVVLIDREHVKSESLK